MEVQEFLTKLEGVTKASTGWSARCPAHQDHNASLSVGEGEDGRILVKCHAGCSTESVVSAMGLKLSDLFAEASRNLPPRPAKNHRGRGRLVATYDYLTKDGEPLVRVLRYDPKSFSRQRPDGHGGWLWGGSENVAALYKWPELAKACAEHGTAYLVEGEKDTENLMRLGLTATTALGGASKWREEYADEFVGLSKLFVITDRDGPQNKYAGQVFANRESEAIRAKGVNVQTIVLPEEVDGDKIKDVSDFLQHGRGLAELEKALADAPAWEDYFATVASALNEQEEAEEKAARERAEAARNPENLSLMDFIRANYADPEHPEIAEVVSALTRWLDAQGRFFNVDGELRYYYRAGNRFFDTLSREWIAWLFRQLPDFGQTGKIGREITASFSKTPLALDAPSTIKVEARRYWDAIDEAVYISNGPESMYKVTKDEIRELRLGEEGVFMQATLAPWRLVEDPLDPLELDVFRDMSCAESQKRLAMLWTYTLPFNQKRKPILLFHGEVGSGKTMAAQAFQALFGLPPQSFAPTRRNEDAFDVFCNEGGIGIVDNVDDAVPWLGNALDVASTGTGNTRRQLYTTKDSTLLRPLSALILTSADATFAGRASTADRILAIEFKRVKRPPKDAALFDEISKNRNRLMSFVARTIQGALRQPVPSDGINARHPDFGLMAQRLGTALGWTDVPKILRGAEDRKELLAIDNDTKYLGPLYEFMAQRGKGWKGDARMLLSDMKGTMLFSENEERNLYPNALGRRITKAWHSLEKILRAKRVDMGHRRIVYTFYPPVEQDEAQQAATGTQGPSTPSQAPAHTSAPSRPQTTPAGAAPGEPRAGLRDKQFDLVEFPIRPWTEADRLA